MSIFIGSVIAIIFNVSLQPVISIGQHKVDGVSFKRIKVPTAVISECVEAAVTV